LGLRDHFLDSPDIRANLLHKEMVGACGFEPQTLPPHIFRATTAEIKFADEKKLIRQSQFLTQSAYPIPPATALEPGFLAASVCQA